jgi:hypothetical protein
MPAGFVLPGGCRRGAVTGPLELADAARSLKTVCVMAPLQWLFWTLLAAAVCALSVWHYRRRETPGRGRTLLALLRGAAAAVLLLLLFNPELPARGLVPVRAAQVLLDASLSMELPVAAASDETRWARAVELARARAGTRPVLLFGETPRPTPAGALPDAAPGDARSLLLPALQAAAEAGVRRVTVITDGGIEDLDAVRRWAPRLGVAIATELVGAELANRSVVEARAPQWAEAGQPVSVEFGISAPAGEPLNVVVRQAGRVIGRAAVPAPAAGRLAAGDMAVLVDPPAGGGWVALEVALEGDDPVPDDDRRTVYVHVSEEPSGIALVSFLPDWEPRFLAPLLEQALGMPLRAYIRGAAGQYIRLAGGLQAGEQVPEPAVRRAVERAGVVVLHGLFDDAPPWARAALATSGRLLVFPGGEISADAWPLPVTVGPEQAGDYFLAATVPASPVAPLLAGLEPAGVAPLTGLRAAAMPAASWAPLMVRRGRQGEPQPLAVAGQTAGRRWVVALGSGYWQWAFRGGEERRLYGRLWSALGGWLAPEPGTAASEPVRPARMATPRGAPVAWLAPGLDSDSLAIRLAAADGTLATDTVVAPTAGDTAFTAAPAPGHYSYRAQAFAGDTVTEAEGWLTVEAYSPELARPRLDLTVLHELPAAIRDAGPPAEPRAGRPLHASPLPYLLLVLLLSAEWILRRRWGLR